MSYVSEFLDAAPVGADFGPAVVVAQGLPPHTVGRYDCRRHRIWCSDGDWEGHEDQFQAHRAACGLVKRKPPKPARPIERWHQPRPNRVI